tara:strand:- start:191 stop:2275 length:2085 start_codon:yes stop_codon:yes gene_type:complete
MATTQENRIIFSIEFTEKGAIHKIGKATVSVQKFETQLKKATLANKQFNQTLSGRESMTTNAGLAGATLVELGRTISDMPYGIRGVANNLSQLSTLFVTMVSKVDNSVKGFARVGRAMKMLQAQLMGPLGLILLFQGALAALDFFAGSTKKAKKEVDKLNEALSKQKGLNDSIQTYVDILKDATATEEQHIVAMAKLQKEGYDETIGSLEEYQAALKQKQKLEIAELQISDKIAASEKKIAEAIEKRDKLQNKVDAAHKNDVLTHSRQRRIDKANELIDSEKKIIEGQKINIKTFMEELANDPDVVGNPFIASLFGLKTTKSDDPKESEVAKIVKRLNKEVQKMSAENARELLDIEKQLALDEINLAEGSRKEKNEAIRLINEKFALELKEFREEELDEFKDFAESEVNESIKYINDLYKDYQNKNKELAKERAAVEKAEQDKIRELLRQTRIDAQLTNQAFTSTLNVLSSLNDIRQEFHQAEIDRLNREKDVVLHNDSLTQAEKEKRLKAIEVKEMAAQKRKIKSERDMFTLEQTLAIAQNVMKAKFFVMEQVRNAQLIAMQGKQAMSSIMLTATEEINEGTMSIGTFMKVLGPAGIIAYGASLGVAIASIIKARKAAQNQIRNIVPEAGGGGGGSAPAVQAPAFNVVGATQESQLAQVIAGAEDKPVKAFVVASDVSTAQELERSTIEGASI